MAKVSVVVPIYGVEQYIERCARSLFNQTLKDMEFIFVDDCTKDNSIVILQNVMNEYPERAKQSRIIHHSTNKGLPTARKSGIMASTGEYIAHCDSDDWVEAEMYKSMYEKAKKECLDIVICDYYRAGKNSLEIFRACEIGYSKEDIQRELFSQKVPFMVWNKLVSKDLYSKDIIYPQRTHAEDMALILQLVFYAEKIGYIRVPYYYYQVNSNTLLHIYNEERYFTKFQDSVDNVKLLEQFYKGRPINNTIQNGLIYLKLTQSDHLLPLIKDKRYYRIWLSTFSEINNRILFNSNIKFEKKLKYYLAKFHLYFIFKFIKKIIKNVQR